MPFGTEVDVLHQQNVATYTQLQGLDGLGLAEKLDRMIHLKQVLRDLCLASRSWDAGMEAIHEADIAALRSLATTQNCPGLVTYCRRR